MDGKNERPSSRAAASLRWCVRSKESRPRRGMNGGFTISVVESDLLEVQSRGSVDKNETSCSFHTAEAEGNWSNCFGCSCVCFFIFVFS